jgi:hypothetical protein
LNIDAYPATPTPMKAAGVITLYHMHHDQQTHAQYDTSDKIN